VAVTSAAALAGLAVRGFAAADALGDAADRMGVTVETLSRLKFVAEQNDVEFGALTTAIKKFQVGLSQAASDGGEASEMLERLKLKASDLKGLKLEEALARIADRVSKLKDPADRTRAAVELFGRSGEQLAPLLNKGGAGIRELADEADRLGITLDSKAVRSIDAADKALKRLKATVDSYGSRLAGSIALAIVGPQSQLDAVAIELEKLEAQRKRILASVGGKTELLGPGFKQELSQIEPAIEALKKLFNEMEEAEEAAKDEGEELGESFSDAMKKLEVHVGAVKIDRLIPKEFTERSAKELARLQAALAKTGGELTLNAELAREFEESTRTAAQQASHDFEALKIKLRELNVTAEEFSKRAGEAIDNALGTDSERSLEVINIRLRKLAEPLTAAQQKVKNFTDALKSGLENAAERGKLKFSDLIRHIIAELLKRQLYAAIDKLGASLNGALSGSGGSGGGGGFFGKALGFLGGLFGIGRAGGGLARPGDIVGEDGPEIAGAPMQVFNRRQLAFAGGAGSNVQFNTTVNVEGGGGSRRDREELGAFLEMRLAQVSKKQAEALNRLFRRNGLGSIR
jgi:hypothetical protein